MIKLLVATRNRHKLEEIRAILGPGFECRSLEDFPDAPRVTEDGRTFAENAEKKARALAQWLAGRPEARSGQPWLVLADDSGLETDALDGAPGVCSARFAAEEADGPENCSDAANNAKLLRLLRDAPPERRGARFRCVMALSSVPPGETRFFEGVCEGRILEAPRGTGGFGYDPLFAPEGGRRAFAEMSAEEKNRLSHRARALAALKAWARDRGL